jgi:hypothetical protein
LPATLLVEDAFRLHGIATRFPAKLAAEVHPEPVLPGVYRTRRGTDAIRVVVWSEVAEAEHNARWHLFSAIAERTDWGCGSLSLADAGDRRRQAPACHPVPVGGS